MHSEQMKSTPSNVPEYVKDKMKRVHIQSKRSMRCVTEENKRSRISVNFSMN